MPRGNVSKHEYYYMQLAVDSTSSLLASLVDTGVTLKQALKSAIAVLFGNATSTATNIDYKAQDGITTVVSGGSFNGTGGRTVTKSNL